VLADLPQPAELVLPVARYVLQAQQAAVLLLNN
jgi:hypothetical protein